MEKEIESLLNELFDLIGIKATFDVQKENDVYNVEVDPGEQAGLLIGAHGATLTAIQSFISIAIKQKTDEWVRVNMDIAGWNKKQNERLEELALQAAARAKQTREEQKLYNLNASQRRIVHMALSKDSDIVTESQGEGQDRYLIVKAK